MLPEKLSQASSPGLGLDPWAQWTEKFLNAEQDLSYIFSNQVPNQQACNALIHWSWTADRRICTQLRERLLSVSTSLKPSNKEEEGCLDLIKTAAKLVASEWRGESVNFFNPTDVPLYARVYECHYGFMSLGNHYEPLSSLVEIPPRSTRTIEYAHGGPDRRVYYTTDSNITDAAYARKYLLRDEGPHFNVKVTNSYGRSYYDSEPLAAKPNLENRNEKVLISNRRHYPVYVRAYVEYENGMVQPTSKIMVIPSRSDLTIDIANGGGKRRIYYTPDVDSPAQAQDYLRDDGTFHGTVRVFQNYSDLFEVNKTTKTGKVIVGENVILPYALHTKRILEGVLNSSVNEEQTQGIRKKCQQEQSVVDKLEGPPKVTSEINQTGDISLSEEEEAFSHTRDVICQQAMRNLFAKGEQPQEGANFPRVGLAGSGGGIRAELAFDGFMAGLYEEGLFQTINYLSSISGSTWAIGDLLESGGDPESTLTLPQRAREGLKRGIVTARFSEEYEKTLPRLQAERREEKPSMPRQLNSALNIALAIAQEASKEPLYDWAVGLQNTALSGSKEAAGEAGLHSLHEYNINPAKIPLPIINFVETVQQLTPTDHLFTSEEHQYQEFKAAYKHDKWEATPFDVTGIPAQEDRGARASFRIPTRGLGRTFDQEGIGQLDRSTPAPLSLLSAIATAGSALTAGLAEIGRNSEIGNSLLRVMDPLIKAKLGVDWNLFPEKVTQRVVENPTLSHPYTGILEGLPVTRPIPGAAGSKAYLRDAGFDYNLPLLSLTRSSRNCGIAILCDVSGNLNEVPGEALFHAAEDALSMGRKLPIDLTDRARFVEKIKKAIANNECPVVFGDPNDPNEFCIIYVPCVMTQGKSDELQMGNWGKYDPTKNITLKLQYEGRESSMLHDFGRRLAKTISPKLKEIERARIVAMNKTNTK